jgi:hypothetical protein
LQVRRVLVGLLTVTLLAGCGTHPTTPATTGSTRLPQTTTPPLPEPECSPDGTALSLGGSDAAMGLRVLTLELANCGDEPFTVSGYPAVRLYDEDHQEITVVVGHGSSGIATVPEFDSPPQAVTLGPGERAQSGLLWRNLVTDSSVKATTAYGMDAAVTEGEAWCTVRGAAGVTIDLGNTGKLGVQAWRKATTPEPGPPSGPTTTETTVDPV